MSSNETQNRADRPQAVSEREISSNETQNVAHQPQAVSEREMSSNETQNMAHQPIPVTINKATRVDLDEALNTDLDEALNTINAEIERKKKILDGYPETPFTAADNMKLYDYVYKLCTRRPPHDYSKMLYEKYESILKEMIVDKVPLLLDKSGKSLLEEFLQLWSKYQAFKKFLLKFFDYLDRMFIPNMKLPSLDTISKRCFHDLVLDKHYHKLQEATIDLVNQMQEGRTIDQELLKNVLDAFAKAGQNGALSWYEKFEQIMLAETIVYYSQLSSEWWFWRDSYANYLRKADWCLAQEERRAELWPLPTTKTKVLEVIKYLLFEKKAKLWAERLKAESSDAVAANQELLAKYTSLNLEDGELCFSSRDGIPYTNFVCKIPVKINKAYKADLKEMLNAINAAIERKKKILDGHPETPFTDADTKQLHDYVYKLCSGMRDYSKELYEKYESILKEMIMEKVPLLLDKSGKSFLEEVLQLWSKYETFKQFLSIFKYLDVRFVPQRKLPSLDTISKQCFRDLVLDKHYHKFQESTIDLVNQMREGRTINQELLKNVLDLFVKVGQNGALSCYEKIEQIMLAETALYYSQLSSEWWFWHNSYANYLHKVDWCFVQEEKRAKLWPLPTTKAKVLEVMKYLLLEKNAKLWAEKQNAESSNTNLAKYSSLNLEDRELCSGGRAGIPSMNVVCNVEKPHDA